jgi:aminoglycoside phosphotransferase (APT) family kinase protein
MTGSDLDRLVRWFEQRHGHAVGIRPDAGYRIDRLGGRRGTSERFRIRFARSAPAPDAVVLLKRYAPERSNIDVANELRGMRIAHATLGATGPERVPTPYACSVDDRVLFMEYCPSVPLNKVIFSRLRWSRLAPGASVRAGLLELAAAAGTLLTRLQAAPVADGGLGLPTAEQVANRYRAQLSERLAGWSEHGLHAGLGRRVREYVSDRLGAPADAGGELVFQHSDFGSWNLLHRPGVLYVTDFHNATLGEREYDVAWFATALDCLGRYGIVAPAILAELRSTFLRHASLPGAPVRAQARFRAFAAMHMIYFGCILLATRQPLRELAYLPLDKRRFVEGWFQGWLSLG